MSKLRKLKITAFLQTAVVCDANGFLPLDGILYSTHVRNIIDAPMLISKSNASVFPRGFDRNNPLPFKKIGVKQDWWHENIWYYACSFAQWRAQFVQAESFWTKRFDLPESRLIDFGKLKGKVNRAQGKYRGYMTPVYYRHAKFVEWFCVGDAERISELLKFTTAIGKKTSQGYGSVLRWEIDDWRWDWSRYDCNGRLMRAIPSQNGVEYGIRPSYWLPRHQIPCMLPIHEIESPPSS